MIFVFIQPLTATLIGAVVFPSRDSWTGCRSPGRVRSKICCCSAGRREILLGGCAAITTGGNEASLEVGFY